MNYHEKKMLEYFPPDPGIVPSTLDFPVVGIGASAGGIAALQHFLEGLPGKTGMAFVIVLHLAPEHESVTASILQLKTRMPVSQVSGDVTIEQDHVYVIPPNRDLLMNANGLHIVPAERSVGSRTTIDKFFRTLAEVHRERAIGVILSGAGSDGAVGIARIKEMGGVTVAQAPGDAEHDGMPLSAIATNAVDIVLPVVEIPQKLVEIALNSRRIVLPEAGELGLAIGPGRYPGDDERERALRDVLAVVQQRTGHDFRHYKRATILRRIERRLQIAMLPDVQHYKAFLETNPNETFALLQDLLISVTNFFRDREAFEMMEREIIPRVFETAAPDEQIRCWSIGCATGEEAYSMAMLLADQNELQPEGQTRSLQVFASDIDARALNVARIGAYPKSIVTDVPPSRLRRYFEERDDMYCIKRELRDSVLFANHNALRDPPFSRVHLLSCRNLMIYLDRDIQQKVFEMMHYALQPDGFLFLGNAESADSVPNLFAVVDKRNRIYKPIKNRPSKYVVSIEPLSPYASVPAMPAALPATGRKERSPQHVFRELIEDAAPPSVMIDERNDLVYTSRAVIRFLRPSVGEPTHHLLDLVHPELQLELRAALFQASQTGQPVETRDVPVLIEGEPMGVRMRIRPDGRRGGTGMTIVFFDASEMRADANIAQPGVAELTIARHLEEELRSTKKQLRGVIDQYEATMGDLKASNEELQAVNEELRSAMEELETSKEELQSVNEELLTVNLELKTKVDETTKANDDLQNFLASTEISTIFVDRMLHIKRYSKPSARLFNLIASDIGRPLADITHRLDYPDMLADIENVVEHLQSTEREVRSAEGDWFIARLLPYRTSADKIDGVVLTFVNITQRKAAEEQLFDNEQRMHLIAASTRDYAIATIDQAGLVTSWNRGAERVFGYTEAEMLGRSVELLLLPEERDHGVIRAELLCALEEGRLERERWLLHKDGTEVFCSDITTPLQDSRVHGFVKIARDLTGSKRMLEQQTARLEWEQHERLRAENATRLRDNFFTLLAHELKQPLHLIQLTSETLQRLPATSDMDVVSHSAEMIKQAIAAEVRLIDDVMDLSQMRSGKLNLHRDSVDMSLALQRAVDMMAASAAQHEVRIVADLPAGPVISGDEARIQQIAWSLLRNAIGRSAAGATVSLRLYTEKSLVCVELEDSGKGFSPARISGLLETVARSAVGQSDEPDVHAISLALVKELVSSHGGWLEIDSTENARGARFRLFFPRGFPVTAEPGPSHRPNDVLMDKNILLIVGDDRIAASLSHLLEREQATVVNASSAHDALEVAGTIDEPFDLVLMDVSLPDMSGLQLLSTLREQPGFARVPFIAMGNRLRDSELAALRSAGFAQHMSLPFSLKHLSDIVVRLETRDEH
jgi:two-component system CheB/CheR fusion protein